MSTTNPGNTGDGPGADRREWPRDAGDGSRPDDHAGGGGANPAAIRAGHEPDVFKVGPIFSIPLAVVIAFGIAFAVGAVYFWYLMNVAPNAEPGQPNPQAVARNEVPLNDRLARINQMPTPGRERDQPRLEPLRRLENNGQTVTQPELPGNRKSTANSPELHPEDLRLERIAEHENPDWGDKEKAFAGRLLKAMPNAADNKALFPVRKDARKPLGSHATPTASNAGRPEAPHANTEQHGHDDHDHHGDHKHDHKEPGKGDAGKKDAVAPPPAAKGDEHKKDSAPGKTPEAKKDTTPAPAPKTDGQPTPPAKAPDKK